MESGQTEQGASHTELVMVFSDLLDPARPKNHWILNGEKYCGRFPFPGLMYRCCFCGINKNLCLSRNTRVFFIFWFGISNGYKWMSDAAELCMFQEMMSIGFMKWTSTKAIAPMSCEPFWSEPSLVASYFHFFLEVVLSDKKTTYNDWLDLLPIDFFATSHSCHPNLPPAFPLLDPQPFLGIPHSFQSEMGKSLDSNNWCFEVACMWKYILNCYYHSTVQPQWTKHLFQLFNWNVLNPERSMMVRVFAQRGVPKRQFVQGKIWKTLPYEVWNQECPQQSAVYTVWIRV